MYKTNGYKQHKHPASERHTFLDTNVQKTKENVAITTVITKKISLV